MLARIREAGFFRCTQPLEAVRGPVLIVCISPLDPCSLHLPDAVLGPQKHALTFSRPSCAIALPREHTHILVRGWAWRMGCGMSTWRMRHTHHHRAFPLVTEAAG